MFIALVASTAAAVLLLLWCYAVNRRQTSLLWLASGFFLSSLASVFLAIRNAIPDWVLVGVGVTALLLGTSLFWCAARAFNGRRIIPWVPLVLPGIWLAAMALPAVNGSFDGRMVLLTVLTAVGYLMAAYEFHQRDGLFNRVALSAVLAIHAVLVLARIPFMLLDDGQGLVGFTTTEWFGVATLETTITIQVITFLVVSLIKERVEHQLRAVALTDSLTGLGNRRAFFDWTNAAIARSERNGSPLSVVVFDLDRFKEINDRFGHPVGDDVIRAFADTARDRLRAGDFVARLGGEEFGIALPDTKGAEASLIALHVNQAFEQRILAMNLDGLEGSACAGVAECPASACSVQDLLTRADRSLYEAKALGRGQVRLNEPLTPAKRVRAA